MARVVQARESRARRIKSDLAWDGAGFVRVQLGLAAQVRYTGSTQRCRRVECLGAMSPCGPGCERKEKRARAHDLNFAGTSEAQCHRVLCASASLGGVEQRSKKRAYMMKE